MATEVWVSTDTAPQHDLELGWALAGTCDQSRERDLWRAAQGDLGYKTPTRQQRVQAYLDVEATTPGGRSLLEVTNRSSNAEASTSAASVWVALRWLGPPPRVLYPRRPITFAPLARRPPEPHPGLLRRPTYLAVTFTADHHGFFTTA